MNSRFGYGALNLMRFACPRAWCRRKLDAVLRAHSRRDQNAIWDRVDYYNKLATPCVLDPRGVPFRFSLLNGQLNYQIDMHRYARCFDAGLAIHCRFGDRVGTPPYPTFVKARTIGAANANAILFKLNQVRHFRFVADRRRFQDKIDKLVWRGNVARDNRKAFMALYCRHERCDVGHALRGKMDSPWRKDYLDVPSQLKFKFILSLEGNDVATNLKWILSSNSLCVMPRPRFETWFMEGRLVPGQHYVPIRDDYSDLPDQLDYYAAHEREALDVVRSAQEHVALFRQPATEDAIALLVLKKYFELSGQWK